MNKKFLSTALLCSFFATACSSDNEVKITTPGDDDALYFNIALSDTPEGGTTGTYVRSLKESELTEGTITFKGVGYEVPCIRTARIYTSQDGRRLYSLDYGGGTVTSFQAFGNDKFTKIDQMNFATFTGSEYSRWTKLNDENAVIHNVVDNNVFDEDGTSYLYTNSKIVIANLDLANLEITKSTSFDIQRDSIDNVGDNKYVYIGRIDAATVMGNKVYYGLEKYKKKASDPTKKESGYTNYAATTLVLDYPQLTNPQLISSKIGKGSTYGFRAPMSHEYNNALYQISEDGHLLRMVNGNYDNSFDLDLSAQLGFNVGAQGWFYVANGVGYCLIYDADDAAALGSRSKTTTWGLARVDILSGTAVKMNLPENLSLFEFQMAKSYNGKLYMPINVKGKAGNVYIFDSAKNDANGFIQGATLDPVGGESLYLGIY